MTEGSDGGRGAGVTVGDAVGLGGLGGSVRDPGIASIGTPSVVGVVVAGVVGGTGGVTGLGGMPGGVMGEVVTGEVVTGLGAWAWEVGISTRLCRVNRTIALKNPRAMRIDRLSEVRFERVVV